jgi:transcriptional regulator with XRE-family HTH domain
MKKRTLTITDAIKQAIGDSRLSLNAIEKATGVRRASLLRFMRGESSLRLDIADKLAEYFGLEVMKRKGK